MPSPTLTTLFLSLENLLTQHLGELGDCLSGKLYTPRLTKAYEEIRALPAALRGMPGALPLAGLDERHDSIRESIDAVVTGHLTSPLTPEDFRAELFASSKRLDEFLPRPQASYAEQVAAAKRAGDGLSSVEPLLARIPVVGGNLADWLRELVATALAMEPLLQDRAAEISAADRRNAAQLRGSAGAALTRFRSALRDELEARPELPRDLEQRLFAYFDQLLAQQPTHKATQPTAP